MGLGVLNSYPVVSTTPLSQLLLITPKLRPHGGIIPTPLPSYNPSWLMTSPAVIQLAPRGSWTGRISPAAAARSVGSLPHWAKGLGGSTGARDQGPGRFRSMLQHGKGWEMVYEGLENCKIYKYKRVLHWDGF